jgi:ubiquinone/menaquinone biosynthesis C-methylase UbiE
MSSTENFWSNNDSFGAMSYYRFPPIMDRYSYKAFEKMANNRSDWMEYWLAKKIFSKNAPFEKVLSLCCGFGHVDRALIRNGLAKHVTGIDLSSGAIAKAKEAALKENLPINYLCADLNKIKFEDNSFDVVYASGALHHLAKLEDVLLALKPALKSGGMLIAYDKIGPNYHYPSKRENEILNAVLHLLPINLRAQFKEKKVQSFSLGTLEEFIKRQINKLNVRGGAARIFYPVPPLYWKIRDPSEGVCAERVKPAIDSIFEYKKCFNLNGGILSYIIGGGFLEHFDASQHLKLLEVLFDLEDVLTDMGEIRVTDAIIIASDSPISELKC